MFIGVDYMKIVGIYKITNLIDDKMYIGQTVNYLKRKNTHLAYLRNGKHHNEHLQRAFNKYGEISFEITFLQECEVDELDKLETEYIKAFKCTNSNFGYNMMTGGQKYRRFTDKVRLKMSQSGKGRIFSNVHKARIGAAHKGRALKPKTIEKMIATKKERQKQAGEKNMNALISDSIAEKIIIDLLNNEVVSDIANKYQVSRDLVYNLMYGRSYRHILLEVREKLNDRTSSIRKSKIDTAIELYLQGSSQNAISKELGISRNTLRREFKKRNIDTKLHVNQYIKQANTEVN